MKGEKNLDNRFSTSSIKSLGGPFERNNFPIIGRVEDNANRRVNKIDEMKKGIRPSSVGDFLFFSQDKKYYFSFVVLSIRLAGFHR